MAQTLRGVPFIDYWEPDCKPGSVLFSQRPSFLWERDCPRPLATYPEELAGPASFPTWSCSERGMPCASCHHGAGGLLPHLSPLPAMPAVCFCGAFQGSPPLDVIQRPALWSPDFPPRRLPRRWSVRLPIFYGICQLKLYQYQPCSPMLHSKKRFAVRYWPSSFLRFSGLASPSSSAASSGVREASGFGSVLFCLISSGISKC